MLRLLETILSVQRQLRPANSRHIATIFGCLFSTLTVTAPLGKVATAQGCNDLCLHVLDVGEGQSILLQQSNRGVLIDTGSMRSAAGVVKKIRNANIDYLDAIILTHLHPDHATGIFRLREAHPDTPVLHNEHPGVAGSGLDSIRWVAESLADDPNAKVFQRDDFLDFADIKIRALWPEPPLPEDLNQSSLVLSIESLDGQPLALLMGDAGVPVENELLERGSLKSQYPLLVAGHHGSRHTASETFLVKVSPEQVAVSINIDNKRGYPDIDTLKRYEAAGAIVWLTYRDGDLCFTGFEQNQLKLCG